MIAIGIIFLVQVTLVVLAGLDVISLSEMHGAVRVANFVAVGIGIAVFLNVELRKGGKDDA